MGWKFVIGFVLLLALSAGGLALYGTILEPPQQSYEQVLPDDQFPR